MESLLEGESSVMMEARFVNEAGEPVEMRNTVECCSDDVTCVTPGIPDEAELPPVTAEVTAGLLWDGMDVNMALLRRRESDKLALGKTRVTLVTDV